MMLRVGKSESIDQTKFDTYFRRILESGVVTNHGQLVRELETKICEFVGVKHCVVVCNATVAIQVVAIVLGLRGKRVIVPSFTFPATAHALAWIGAEPLFVDVDLSTHNIDARSIESSDLNDASAIVAVNLWGRPCDIVALDELSNAAGIPVIYDSAHAFGVAVDGRRIGTFGRAEVFSFHATKFFSTGEGGAIVTDDDALAESCRQVINFGAGVSGGDLVGTNAKMNEISAAFGLTMFDEIERMRDRNRFIYQVFKGALRMITGVEVIEMDAPGVEQTYHYMLIEVDGVIRDDLVRWLSDDGVACKRYFCPPCSELPPYASTARACSNSVSLSKRLVSLPMGAQMDSRAIDHVCGSIERFMKL